MDEGFQWKNNEENDNETLKRMNIQDELIYLRGSASNTLHVLQDTLHNSLHGISKIMEIS